MHADAGDGSELDAGAFGAWLGEVQEALRGARGSDVPCGSCTACCTASQFIHIGPDEADTLALVPPELLFPAPGLQGHVLMGYDERGHCPMLVDGLCTIYAHRPRTCRTYDCRVFPATGIEPDGEDSVLIAGQARRWRFAFPAPADRTRHEAVQAAATFLRGHPEVFPDGAVVRNPTQLAVLAIEVHAAFLRRQPAGLDVLAEPDPDLVRAALTHGARRRGAVPAP